MKQLFLILASLLVFSSVGEDSIKIQFNGKTFAKLFPKNYKESVETIKSMEYLFNSLDSTYTTLNTSYDSLKNESLEMTKYVESHLQNINCLTEKNDSLNKIIVKNATIIQETTKVYTDSIKFLLSKIQEKPIMNTGIKISGNGSFDKHHYNDISISPILMYKKIFMCVNLGLYSQNYNNFSRRIGYDVGFLLK